MGERVWVRAGAAATVNFGTRSRAIVRYQVLEIIFGNLDGLCAQHDPGQPKGVEY